MHFKPKIGFILACVFLDALGIGLIVPVLPRLIGVLSESRDSQTLWYGAIMLSYGLAQFACAPFLGALSDKFGRRPVLLTGILGLGLMFAVPAFIASLPLILLSRIVGGMFSSNMAVAKAYTADITEGTYRAAAFGKIGAAFAFGFLLGPALGGIFGQTDPRTPFIIAMILSLINFAYGFIVLPESLNKEKHNEASLHTCNPLLALPSLFNKNEIRPLVIILALTTLTNCVLQCTWALYTEFRYGFSPLEIGLSIFGLGLAISVCQGVLLPLLLRRICAKTIIPTSLIVATLSLITIGVTPSGNVAIAFCCLYAVASTVSPILIGAISCQTTSKEQGKTIGAISSLEALAGVIAPILGTPLLHFAGEKTGSNLVGAPYFFGALLLILALTVTLTKRNKLSLT